MRVAPDAIEDYDVSFLALKCVNCVDSNVLTVAAQLASEFVEFTNQFPCLSLVRRDYSNLVFKSLEIARTQVAKGFN